MGQWLMKSRNIHLYYCCPYPLRTVCCFRTWSSASQGGQRCARGPNQGPDTAVSSSYAAAVTDLDAATLLASSRVLPSQVSCQT
jgi:hypothetical protein